MKKLFLVLLLYLFSNSCYSQILSFQWNFYEKPKIEKILATELAVLLNATIDYAGYNIQKHSTKNEPYYRAFQYTLQAGTTYFLAKKYGIKTALAFNIQMWGSNQDAYYYMIDGISKGFNGFSNGNEYHKTNNFNHLTTNPMYWINGGRMNKADLITSVLFTKSISIILNSY